ncbi:MAG: hypothetical protein ACOYXT_09390 [Bacteroidota bacterium]
MKTKIILLIVALVTPLKEYAQTQLNKTFPMQGAQRITMHFDYPELIRVTTWDKNEVSIQGSISINSGEHDDAFTIEGSTSGTSLSINAYIKNMKSLPQRITIIRNGEKIIFKDKTELKKYQAEHGKGYDVMNYGLDMDILLEIKVPKNIETRIESVYGMVEIKSFEGPLTVEATYGGVDAALTERATGEVIAETNYGEIYTNLDVKFGGESFKNEDFHTYVTAKPGTGPRYSFESKYGNVYIRKAAN